jgi:hypothetical protein
MASPVLPAEPTGPAVGATATLSFVGGFVDIVGFIALFGLFTRYPVGRGGACRAQYVAGTYGRNVAIATGDWAAAIDRKLAELRRAKKSC